MRTKYHLCVKPDVDTDCQLKSLCNSIIAVAPLMERALLNERKRHVPLLSFEMDSDYVDVVLHIMGEVFIKSEFFMRRCGATVADVAYRCAKNGHRIIYANVDFSFAREMASVLKQIRTAVASRHLHVDFGPTPLTSISLFNTALGYGNFTTLVNDQTRRVIRPILAKDHEFGRFGFHELLLCESRSTDFESGFYNVVDSFKYKFYPTYQRVTVGETFVATGPPYPGEAEWEVQT